MFIFVCDNAAATSCPISIMDHYLKTCKLATENVSTKTSEQQVLIWARKFQDDEMLKKKKKYNK